MCAVCFAQTLLRYGANTELRDEEGKLAVEKARERNSEGHREVVAILHTPRTLDSHSRTSSSL